MILPITEHGELVETTPASIHLFPPKGGILATKTAISFHPAAKAFKTGPQLNRRPRLEDPVDMNDPHAVFREVFHIVDLIHPGLNSAPIRTAIEQILRLFRGEFPGYRECRTCYHDLKHTTDCLLAMARIIHGASLRGMYFSPGNLILGLIAAALHDTGYIQKIDEKSGTGAQFTLVHIDRSIAFMETYMDKYGSPGVSLQGIRDCMRCTGLDVRIQDIVFENEELEFLGKALGAADLLGQMGSRTYVERIPLLYLEFREGKVPGFRDEFDLLKKTPGFWEFTKIRFAIDLDGVDSFIVDHFRARWGIDFDLYRLAIDRNIQYINFLIELQADDYTRFLKREP